MRFPPSFLDEIRNRVPVSAVVGKRVRLKKQGRELAGLSPFTKEKTPSFFVNDDKRFYHCFSSGKHGDIFTFLMETEGVSFPEAVERLAGEAGLPMPKADPQAQARERERAGLHEVMEMAAAFFQAQLAERAGANARSYLDRRGVSPATREAFGIGYAPSGRHHLKEYLAARGVAVSQMAEAGLIITGDDISVPFDRFRDRVMFPIRDMRGRVIAFGGRALSEEQKAKYLNSPETPLFHKGDTLFNIAAARKAAHGAGTVHVVEGYMDVIAMTEGGFANTVAPLGTALTGNQLALLWRMADEPVLCFDGDSAGLPGGMAGRRTGVAAPQAGQEPAIRADAQGPGSRRPAAIAGARSAGAGARRHPQPRRHRVDDGRGNTASRHSREARRAGGAAGGTRARGRRRGGAPPLRRGDRAQGARAVRPWRGPRASPTGRGEVAGVAGRAGAMERPAGRGRGGTVARADFRRGTPTGRARGPATACAAARWSPARATWAGARLRSC